MSRTPLVLQAFRQPSAIAAFSLADWDLLLRQGQAAMLLASLHALLDQHGLLAQVPAQPRAHLDWAWAEAVRHRDAVHWEVRMIAAALAGLDLAPILLKGGAYVLAGLPAGAGRVFSDIDIMVPKARIGEAEAALMMAGWFSSHHDAYDQRYYRDWMHELPPMMHMRRHTLLDVHHAILPETAAARPDPASLQAAAVPVPGHPGLKMFAPADMLIHSAVHLFYDGELNHGMRDLVDLQHLLADFGARPGFWAALGARAQQLEAQRPLFYALHFCARLLQAPLPPEAHAAVAGGRPGAPLLALMNLLFGRALLPAHHSIDDWLTGAARSALYIRGNWLRMPPLMLARHLFHKAFLTKKPASPAKDQADPAI